MNTGVGHAQIGQWYLNADQGQIFQVTGLDADSSTIEIQTFDGDVDEIDEDSWFAMPLGLAEQPEDWTGPVDSVDVDDLGYSETELTANDSETPLQRLNAARKPWEEPSDLGDADDEEEQAPPTAAVRDTHKDSRQRSA
ncbi:MAG: DUF6763 family protein [Steroidobacteraceae bacterium]|jgi:hypothetical protein